MLSDMLLIWRFRSGDSAALAKIYADHRQNLLRVAAGLLNQTSLAEDIVHDVFVQLAQSPQKVRLRGHLRSFRMNSMRSCSCTCRPASRFRTSAPKTAAPFWFESEEPFPRGRIS